MKNPIKTYLAMCHDFYEKFKVKSFLLVFGLALLASGFTRSIFELFFLATGNLLHNLNIWIRLPVMMLAALPIYFAIIAKAHQIFIKKRSIK